LCEAKVNSEILFQGISFSSDFDEKCWYILLITVRHHTGPWPGGCHGVREMSLYHQIAKTPNPIGNVCESEIR